MPEQKDIIQTLQSQTITIFDAALMVSVGLLLTAIQLFVPESAKAVLAFNHSEFNIWGLYTAAYIHTNFTHLLNNLTAYSMAAAYTYWLCSAVNTRQWFRRTFAALLVVLPPLITFTSYLILKISFSGTLPPERGFSGVASGFGGFLLVALVIYLRKHYNPALGNIIGAAVVFLLLIEISFIYTGRIDPLIVGLSLFGVVLMVVFYLWEHDIKSNIDSVTLQAFKPTILGGLVVLVLTYFVFAMFPTAIVENGNFRNIFAHAAGFIWGALFALITWRYSAFKV
ncbi:hypothetical protein [Natrinema sp. DC36]|uniref:hypothetical protein n=1 Tax=Natrinema sp. DC36 TaxID=2878680 RepID=UPI001CEFC9F5|nr:hypothetical protein [Natrinema sp. DC36]